MVLAFLPKRVVRAHLLGRERSAEVPTLTFSLALALSFSLALPVDLEGS